MTKTGAGLLWLTGANTYGGATTVAGGELRAVDGVSLPSAGLLNLNGGTLETSGSFIRTLGSSAGNVELTAGGSAFTARNGAGFNAFNGLATISIGGLISPSTLQWGTATFNPLQLLLNTATANSPLVFANAIDLNGNTRTIVDGITAASETAAVTLSGNITTSVGVAGLHSRTSRGAS